MTSISLPFCPHPTITVAVAAHAAVLRVAGGRLCPWPSATALGRQPLLAGGAASRCHLVRRPAHEHCVHKWPPLRVGVALQVVAHAGAVLQEAAPTGRCCKRLPLRVAALVGGLGHSRSPPYRWPGRGRPPLQGAWPWPTTLAKGLAMADHPLSSLPSLQKCNKNA
ncbi:hypothetical protein BHM03_00046406 [Ensete ventricosum]|nr:hypothetical protein BHM03_00046406 [Ensete ventricosum]